MTPQDPNDPLATVDLDDEVWQPFFSTPEPARSATDAHSDGVSTGDLFSEIVRRTHGDIPALRELQADVLQALLNAIDRQRRAG